MYCRQFMPEMRLHGTAAFWCTTVFLAIAAFDFCHGDYSYTVQVAGNLTLDRAFNQTRRSSTQYILSEGTHYLSENVTFENLEMIAFVGSNSTINCTVSDVGFAFTDMKNLSFANLTITGCSALRNSTSRNFQDTTDRFSLYTFYVGLYFYHCRDVEISGVTVRDSPNALGVVMYDTDGTVAITNSSFINNGIPTKCSDCTRPGGGGFYVEFSYCIPGDQSCTNDTVSYESQNMLSYYSFTECNFALNSAIDYNSTLASYIVPYRNNHESFGRGGGLSIFFKGNASDNVVDIAGCVFDSNQGVWGGGLFVEFHDDSANNTVLVTQSNFTHNRCKFDTDSGTGSGGMRIGYLIYYNNPYSMIGNSITVYGSYFHNNSALNGGGLSVVPAAQTTTHNLTGSISIINSIFDSNVARLGAAITVDRFSLPSVGLLPRVSIEYCSFNNNTVDYVQYIEDYTNKPYQVGKGAVFIHQVDVSFAGVTSFSSNNGTALVLVGTAVDLTGCAAWFLNNTGDNGGGIALLGAAYILINDDTQMYFYFNKAFLEGGAIYNRYIEEQNLRSYKNCFIRHEKFWLHPDEWNSYFHFWLNKDHNGKRNSSIHSTSVLPCLWAGGSGIADNRTRVFCWNHWLYYEHLNKTIEKTDVNCSLEVSTDVGNIAFTNKSESNTIKALPGQPVVLPITVNDDFTTNVHSRTVFQASIDSTEHSIGSDNSDDYGDFAFVWEETVTVRGPENSNVTLQLDSSGDRKWHLEVVVELQECPPGFQATGNSSNTECQCVDTDSHALVCDQDSIALLKNENWMGKVNDSSNELESNPYAVSYCPPGYCFSNTTSAFIYLLKDAQPHSLDELICKPQNRTGVLCGECVDGFGPAVNTLTNECVNCSDENIAANVAKYVASVYIPLGFLFTILILFDIRLTTGPANAFILYCQVVASTFDLNADGQIPLKLITKHSKKLLKAYQVPYGVFNLEFIENFLPPLCLGTHLNNLSVFLLDYAVAISPLLMIIFIIVCVKVTGCITSICNRHGSRLNRFRATLARKSEFLERRSISESILPAFAAFLLLSYTKFSIVSSYLVGSQHLLKEDGSFISPSRAYFAGKFTTTDTVYRLHYLLPAVLVFATFVSITPILLLDYPLRVFEWCIGKVDCVWKRYPVDKVHVLLDTFQGCYKNKMRFFAGLYFLFRLTINVSYILKNTWLKQFVVQQIACAVMIMMLALCQPYKTSILNYVDIMIFTNLAVLNAFSFYLYSLAMKNPHLPPPTSAFVIQYLLVFLPLFYMLGYIIWRVTKPCHHRIKHYLHEIVTIRLRSRGYRNLEQIAGDHGKSTSINASRADDFGNSTEVEAMFARAQLENTYRPVPPQGMPPAIQQHHTGGGDSQSEDSGLRTTQSSGNQPGYGSTSSTQAGVTAGWDSTDTY